MATSNNYTDQSTKIREYTYNEDKGKITIDKFIKDGQVESLAEYSYGHSGDIISEKYTNYGKLDRSTLTQYNYYDNGLVKSKVVFKNRVIAKGEYYFYKYN